MKHLIGVVFGLIILILSLTSCSDDKISKDAQRSFATVYVDKKGEAQYFMLDNQTSLYVVKSETNYVPKYPRVFIDYTLLDADYLNFDYAIRLNGYIYDILTKSIAYVDPDNQVLQDSIGYNAVNVVSAFAKGNYITLRFNYKKAGLSSQLFTMLAVDENIDANSQQPVQLSFRHNIEEDEENYFDTDTYICFNISEYVKSYAQADTPLVFNISWTDYEGAEQQLLLVHSNN